ncbi:MAG: hypothetical protein KGY56_13735, partial [Desulfobacterales bacterium]|nr:hypothetical protein [Desulfobacterales bacterium]
VHFPTVSSKEKLFFRYIARLTPVVAAVEPPAASPPPEEIIKAICHSPALPLRAGSVSSWHIIHFLSRIFIFCFLHSILHANPGAQNENR